MNNEYADCKNAYECYLVKVEEVAAIADGPWLNLLCEVLREAGSGGSVERWKETYKARFVEFINREGVDHANPN